MSWKLKFHAVEKKVNGFFVNVPIGFFSYFYAHRRQSVRKFFVCFRDRLN